MIDDLRGAYDDHLVVLDDRPSVCDNQLAVDDDVVAVDIFHAAVDSDGTAGYRAQPDVAGSRGSERAPPRPERSTQPP